MKFHLPKKLMVAVLAAMCISSTYARVFAPGQIIGIDVNGNPISGEQSYSDLLPQVKYAPVAKDGNGTLSFSSSGTINAPLFVREGTVVVGKQTDHVTFSLNPDRQGDTDVGATNLVIGGKNSSMIVTNATIQTNGLGSNVIGGADGSGSLTLQEGSDFRNKVSLFIGHSTYAGGTVEGHNLSHASTNKVGDERLPENRYRGEYSTNSPSTGKGIVNIIHSNYTCTDWGGLFVGEGELNISDNSTVLACRGMSVQTGYQENSKSVINISGNSTFEARSESNSSSRIVIGAYTGSTSILNISDSTFLAEQELRTGAGKNSKNFINLDNSELSISSGKSMLVGYGSVDSQSGKHMANGSSTQVNLINNSTLNVRNVVVACAADDSTINIDSTSRIEGTGVLAINERGSVQNSGIIQYTETQINNGGLLSMNAAGATLETENLNVYSGGTLQAAGGDPISIDSDSVTVEDGGVISLKDGSTLAVTGALTMESGSILRLSANNYAAGDTLLSSGNGDLDVADATVEVSGGQANYIIKDGTIIITAVFDNSIAEALTVTNWGIATASRTFVNAVRGQRTNTGCIANGRGTAWAAVLGATSDIGSGDVDLKGAAVGADMKVGEKSSLGVAFGYIDGDAKIPGMSKAEQEGTYVALYGEHGLKKLSATSCLSLDWVAAYGQTDTEWKSADWEQQSLQLNTRLNWNKKVTDRLCMSVFGGLEYFTSESDRVENAKTGSIQNLRGEIGVGARYVAWGTPGSEAVTDEKGATIAAARPGCEKLVLHGEIRYMNDMVRSNPVIEQDGLRGSGDNPGRQGMGIEAGATYRISERWSASANYGFNTMEDSKEHRVNVGASYTF